MLAVPNGTGINRFVLPALQGGPSIRTGRTVSGFPITVEILIQVANVYGVIKDTISKMEFVSIRRPMIEGQLTKDVHSGTGNNRFASNVLKGGFSALKIDVSKSQTSVDSSLPKESVPPVSKAMI